MVAAVACGVAAVLAAGAANALTPPMPGGEAPPGTAVRASGLRHQGGLAMPFIGMHSVRGDAGQGYDAGLRVGLLAGGYAFGKFSFNGEIVLDWANPSQPGADVTSFTGDAAFSPLYHHSLGKIELIVGPKLGYFYSYAHTEVPILGATNTTGRGLTLGLNAGALVAATPSVAFGLLLSYQFRDPSEVCATARNIKTCQGEVDASHILGFNAAILF